jgi:hypothetical protein
MLETAVASQVSWWNDFACRKRLNFPDEIGKVEHAGASAEVRAWLQILSV